MTAIGIAGWLDQEHGQHRCSDLGHTGQAAHQLVGVHPAIAGFPLQLVLGKFCLARLQQRELGLDRVRAVLEGNRRALLVQLQGLLCGIHPNHRSVLSEVAVRGLLDEPHQSRTPHLEEATRVAAGPLQDGQVSLRQVIR